MLYYYFSLIEEFNGYECEGHYVPHIVAANSLDEARKMLIPTEQGTYYTEPTPLTLPSLTRKKKTFELLLWSYAGALKQVPYSYD